MKREDVPAEMVEKGRNALGAHLRSLPPAGAYLPTLEERTRAILAAVLPVHERMVREQIARDLLEERRKVAEQEGATQRDNDVINGICNGLIAAVRIAGGES